MRSSAQCEWKGKFSGRGAIRGGCTSKMAESVKAEMSQEEQDKHDSNYQKLLALYVALLTKWDSDSTDALFELCEQRADSIIEIAFEGMGVDYDKALQLLKNKDDNNLTQHDKDVRDRIVAAVNNLIDFAVCEEYQLYLETAKAIKSGGDILLDPNSDEYVEIISSCKKYNDTYASVEDSDVKYAMGIAAWWIGLGNRDYLMYMTQNDSRVRPWHMELQGYIERRDDFPSWMIPPIEWHCRCFLEVVEPGMMGKGKNIKKVMGKTMTVTKPSQIDGVFSESVAKCGRIFGPSHGYFSVEEKDKDMLDGFVSAIKQKYYG